jgi:hypothetical protein
VQYAPLLLVVLLWIPRLSAQGPQMAVAVRYSATQLNCARFLESAESSIQTQFGGRSREQTSGRRGVWRFRATSSDNEVVLEGWLDSLALWRRSAETTVSPDTDGLVGGRYRGSLSGAGAYVSRTRPFIPDEVGEVAGMGTALDDFFPPLPQRPLAPGQAWKDSPGVTIRRMPDSAVSGVPLYRFELQARREARSAEVEGDTVPIKLRQISQERGTFVWHPRLGLLRRERLIVIETTVPPGRSVRRPVRSRIEQRISTVRDLTVPPDVAGRCGATPS